MMWNLCPPSPTTGLIAQFTLDTESVVLGVALIALIIAGGCGVFWVKRWMAQDLDLSSETEQMAGYERLKAEGLLQPLELERIKARLAVKIQTKIQAKAEGPVPSSSPPVQPPDIPWPNPPADHGDPSHG